MEKKNWIHNGNDLSLESSCDYNNQNSNFLLEKLFSLLHKWALCAYDAICPELKIDFSQNELTSSFYDDPPLPQHFSHYTVDTR